MLRYAHNGFRLLALVAVSCTPQVLLPAPAQTVMSEPTGDQVRWSWEAAGDGSVHLQRAASSQEYDSLSSAVLDESLGLVERMGLNLLIHIGQTQCDRLTADDAQRLTDLSFRATGRLRMHMAVSCHFAGQTYPSLLTSASLRQSWFLLPVDPAPEPAVSLSSQTPDP